VLILLCSTAIDEIIEKEDIDDMIEIVTDGFENEINKLFDTP
jgi:hypothetical protein